LELRFSVFHQYFAILRLVSLLGWFWREKPLSKRLLQPFFGEKNGESEANYLSSLADCCRDDGCFSLPTGSIAVVGWRIRFPRLVPATELLQNSHDTEALRS
jgi:hypothetical protein